MIDISITYSSPGDRYNNWTYRKTLEVSDREHLADFAAEFERFLKEYENSRPEYYTTQDLSYIFETSTNTICNWVKNGMPMHLGKDNRQYLFIMDEIGTWIRDNKPKYYKSYTDWKKRKENRK